MRSFFGASADLWQRRNEEERKKEASSPQERSPTVRLVNPMGSLVQGKLRFREKKRHSAFDLPSAGEERRKEVRIIEKGCKIIPNSPRPDAKGKAYICLATEYKRPHQSSAKSAHDRNARRRGFTKKATGTGKIESWRKKPCEGSWKDKRRACQNQPCRRQ